MEYRNLGKSGLKVSVAGLGCNNFGGKCDAAATVAVVARALDEGITFFDTAEMYNNGVSEELLGKALGLRRKDVVVASKGGFFVSEGRYLCNASRKYIMAAADASLRRMGIDYFDLYQIHVPDPNTPQEETLRALDDLVRAGKVRYIGCSNFAGWELTEAILISKAAGLSPYISAQNHYNLLERGIEGELIPACRHFGVGLVPFYPLASGFLTGKYRRNAQMPKGSRLAGRKDLAERLVTDANFVTIECLERYAEERGHTLLELALSWLASQPVIPSVIAGATSAEQVTANVQALNWKLTSREFTEVDTLLRS